MNICVATTRHAAKDDRIYYKEVLSLAKRWDNITLVAPRVAGETGPSFDSRVHFQPIKRRRGLLGRCKMVADVVCLLRKLRPDVCAFHDYDLAAVLPFARKMLQAKLVYDVHEFYPLTSLPSLWPAAIKRPASMLIAYVEEAAARRCAVVTTTVDPLTVRFQRAGCHAVTIFNYVRSAEIKLDQQRQCQLRNRYQGRKIIIYQGSISAERGLLQMIAAMSKLRQFDSSIMLLLVGEMSGSLLGLANAQVTKLGLTYNIEHVPLVDHTVVFDYVNVAKIGLIPILPVGQYPRALPIKLFEYMACGVPVLSADLPSVRPYIEESRAGLLYDSTSPEALAEGVLRMLSDEEGLKQMGENGRTAVREKWNWGKMEERLFEAYGELDAQLRRQPGAPRQCADTRSASR